ncbi:N-acetylglucosamine-6-phosphate deacetylase [Sporofaciens musculi]|jgi:N-acetylglucosamine-6-phosphate deacetylase|uniref:N-acetylglucosamine-6-phosphate deacetylase n=1 Tax=Sporofaciens musculi TaxID=2681861 RepID=UPI0025710E66|nr:N-acetylglucosamine-6-phosphate deacetylase [Sporofaciens musculi]
MIIRNVKVYTEDKRFVDGEIAIQDGRIESVGPSADLVTGDDTILDGEGCYALPGLIDIHFHGCKGYDFCDGTQEAIRKIAEYEASIGVTAISPATMTLPVNELEEILAVAANYRKEAKKKAIGTDGAADLVGVNMEGPFISEEKKGAQDERNIITCDSDICQRFLDASEGLVKFVGIAPERNEDASEFIRKMKDQVHISLAHTNADYDTAMAAFDAGADHAVHLYNAMPAFTHRKPGVVGAVSDSTHVNAEMICDGIHIHPSVVRATFKMLGAHRIVLISDSMRATGMPEGQYTLGGLDVNVADGRATLVSNGALAGSATNLMECMKTVVQKMGISLETAVACATMNPAKCLGIYDAYGSLTPGKKGNVVLLDKELNLKAVVKDGVRIR